MLSDKEIAVHKSYYANTYEGRFGWFRLGNVSSLSMFVKGYEFVQCQTRITLRTKRNMQAAPHSDSLHCIWNGCEALIRVSINPEMRELCYHEENEHSHCEMPLEKIQTVKKSDLNIDYDILRPSDLQDSDFTRAYLMKGRQVIDVESKHVFNDGTKITLGCHWYECSSKKAFGCKARGFLKKIGNELKFTCSLLHTHGPPPMVSKL